MLGKQPAKGKLTAAEINSILNCIAEIRHFALRKWRNMKTGEKTYPSALEVMATMRGQQPGKGTPEKKQPGKGTPEKKKSSPKKMAALPVAQAETVEPEKAWTPTKRLKSKTGPILTVAVEELSGVEEDEVLSVSSNSGTAVSSALCAEQLVKAGAVMKKPATGNCTPVKKRPGSPKKLQETCQPAKGCLEAKCQLGHG